MALKLVHESAPCAGLVKTGIPGSQPLSVSSCRSGVCASVCVCVCTGARTRSVLPDSMTLCTGACQALCQWNFPGKRHCSVLPLLPPGDLPNPGIKRQISFVSCFGRRILYYCATWEAHRSGWGCRIYIQQSPVDVTAAGPRTTWGELLPSRTRQNGCAF